MQKATGKASLLTALFTLCMLLSLAPISAFADGMDFLPQGVTYSKYNKHTYHTQVNVTANVSVKDSTGTVLETTQVSKSSEDYLKGGVGSLQAELAKLQDEIETPYQAKGTVTREDGSGQSILDHFESATFYTFTPTSGDPVEFSTDLDAAKQYFSEHPDAAGTFTELLDIHEYQKYNYTYDLTVQPSAIPSAAIENAKFNYQPGDAPQAAAWVAETDTDKYEIAYECWQQFENNDPVAAWYSDNGSHGSLPTITAFESGKTYVYSLMLKPKDGYSFSSETVITVNGQKVSAPFAGGSMYIPSIKTITMPTVTVIDVVEINGVTVSFQDGDKPVFTGKVPDGANYAYRCEWWELNSTTGAMSTDFGNFYENKITAFEAGKTYHYGVYVTTYGDVGNVRYVFGPDTKLKINGEFVNYTRYEGDTSDGSDGTMWVLTDLAMTPSSAPHSHSYGTAWKYDETNHWHECACGDTADKASHTFKWVTDKEATAAEKGSKHEECTVCGYKKAAVEIPAAGSVTKPTAPTDKPGNTASPRTGDTGSLALWITLLFVSCGAAISTTVGRKKYNR